MGEREFVKPYKSLCQVQEAFDPTAVYEELKDHTVYYIEPKIDGMALWIEKAEDEVRLYSADKLELSEKFPKLVEAVRELPLRIAILVGELVAVGEFENPLPHEEIVGISHQNGVYEGDRIRFIGYDMLSGRYGRSLKDESLALRRGALMATLPIAFHECNRPNPILTHIPFDKWIKSEGYPKLQWLIKAISSDEGVVVKSSDSTYDRVGSKDWMKLKWYHELDLMVLGKRLVKNSTCTYNYEVGFRSSSGQVVCCGKSMNSNVQAEIGQIITCKVERIKRYGEGRFGVYLARVSDLRLDKTEPDPERLLEIRCGYRSH